MWKWEGRLPEIQALLPASATRSIIPSCTSHRNLWFQMDTQERAGKSRLFWAQRSFCAQCRACHIELSSSQSLSYKHIISGLDFSLRVLWEVPLPAGSSCPATPAVSPRAYCQRNSQTSWTFWLTSIATQHQPHSTQGHRFILPWLIPLSEHLLHRCALNYNLLETEQTPI